VLDRLRGLRGIPTVIWTGTESLREVIVFDHPGPTLYDVFKSSGTCISLNTVTLVAEQLVRSAFLPIRSR
jgi:hypothetical protein